MPGAYDTITPFAYRGDTSLPGRPGFHRVRTPQVDHAEVAALIQATAGLRADPAELLAEQAPGLRVAPPMPAPGEVA
jgi:hypothetical protein